MGRSVKYEVSSDDHPSLNAGLVQALRMVFEWKIMSIQTVFALVTAFAHPRRIEIVRALRAGPATMDQLRATTGISLRSLRRHLAKLERRRFIKHRDAHYVVIPPSNPFRRELIRLTEV